MTAVEREALVAKQTRGLTLLQDKQDLRQLDRNDQLEVVNTLEDIKATVTQAEDDRQFCERVRSLGSNVPRVMCMTAGARREQRERALQLIENGAKCFDDKCIAFEPKG